MYMYVWVSMWLRMSWRCRRSCARSNVREVARGTPTRYRGPCVGVHLVVRAAMGARAGLCCSLPENVGDEQWVKRTTPCKKTEVIS